MYCDCKQCKTFKEAQSALTPLTFISLFPGMIAFMIGTTGTPLLSVIPFINYTVVFTDTSAGNVDWSNIALMVISTIIYISIVLTYIIKQYKSEKNSIFKRIVVRDLRTFLKSRL